MNTSVPRVRAQQPQDISETLLIIAIVNWVVLMFLDATSSPFFTEALTAEVQTYIKPVFNVGRVLIPLISTALLVISVRLIIKLDKEPNPKVTRYRLVATIGISGLFVFGRIATEIARRMA